MLELIDKLYTSHTLSREELTMLLSGREKTDTDYLFDLTRQTALAAYGKNVYLRGLIEFTSYCRQNCYYCGIRSGNSHAERYRLTPVEILDCCRKGYMLNLRTFVLQGGEDPYYTDTRMCDIVSAIRREFPDCAITLSIGERDRESYQRLFDAGADRYLLRHETANDEHYRFMHPVRQSLTARMECLWNLKDIGYQVGCGFMVGSPGQTTGRLVDDLMFIQEFKPHMVGIGPFIPHADTPFGQENAGTLEQTLFLLAVIRLILPHALIPATTALGTICQDGRERGILAGANVVMPNLTPLASRGKYLLYQGKETNGDEAENCKDLRRRIEGIGYAVAIGRGDWNG